MFPLWPVIQEIFTAQGEVANHVSSVTSSDNSLWFVRFLTDNGVAISALFFIGWVFVTRVWPFYTDRWFPAHIARENARDQTLGMLAAAVVELKSQSAATVGLVGKVADVQSRIEVALAVLLARRGKRNSPSGEKRVEDYGGQA